MEDQERSELEDAVDHRFREVGWLEQALTHRSSRESGAGSADNERLEFLGDAVLGLLVSDYLVARFPEWSEGQLSKSKGRLVSARALQGAGERLGLGRHLRLGHGEEESGGRQKRTLLAGAFEALIAAVYLDGGLEAAGRFVRRALLEPVVGDAAEALAQPDHKSALQEWLQSRGWRPAEYRVVGESGPDHAKTFSVEVRWGGRTLAFSEGLSKKEAEQRAAEQALIRLRAERPPA